MELVQRSKHASLPTPASLPGIVTSSIGDQGGGVLTVQTQQNESCMKLNNCYVMVLSVMVFALCLMRFSLEVHWYGPAALGTEPLVEALAQASWRHGSSEELDKILSSPFASSRLEWVISQRQEQAKQCSPPAPFYENEQKATPPLYRPREQAAAPLASIFKEVTLLDLTQIWLVLVSLS